MGQPACSEKDLLTNLIKSPTKMASGDFCLCRSSRRNLPIDLVEDELAKDPGPVKGSHLGSISPAPSRNPTPGLKLVPALIPAPVFAPAPPSSNELFRQFMRAYLELN